MLLVAAAAVATELWRAPVENLTPRQNMQNSKSYDLKTNSSVFLVGKDF